MPDDRLDADRGLGEVVGLGGVPVGDNNRGLRSELIMIGRAIRQGHIRPWELPEYRRQAIYDAIDRGLVSEHETVQLRAAQVAAQMQSANIDDLKTTLKEREILAKELELDDKMRRLDTGAPTEIRVVVEYSDKHVTFKHDP